MDSTSSDVTHECPRVTQEDLNRFRFCVNQMITKVQKLEKKTDEVEQFYNSTNDQVNNSKDKVQEKHLIGTKKPSQGVPSREAVASESQELMHHFSSILHKITQHKWAWPFMDPVDVEGLGLHDYYEVIDKPMDFNTIKRKMNAKDDSGYKNVREIYYDVRLIFENAMKYNDEKNDIHVMAKTLLDKFEKKWQHFLPKVVKAEEAQVQLDMQLAQEATYANMTRELSNELSEADRNLKNLKAMVMQKCRKLSSPEKTKLGEALRTLSPEDHIKALHIVSENNPSFESNAELVTLDLQAQSDFTLWRLNNFAKKALGFQGRTVEGTTVNHDNNIEDENNDTKRRRVL